MSCFASDAGSYRILIAGCGELGSRHLQAVAALSQVREVEVVDLRPEALALGKQQLSEVQDRAQDVVYLRTDSASLTHANIDRTDSASLTFKCVAADRGGCANVG